MSNEYADRKYSDDLSYLFLESSNVWCPPDTTNKDWHICDAEVAMFCLVYNVKKAITIQMCLDVIPKEVLLDFEIYNHGDIWAVLYDCDGSLDFIEFQDSLLVNSLCKFLLYLKDKGKI